MQKKKLEGLCEEHNLVYTFRKDVYPPTLTIKATDSIDGQMPMFENAEEEIYRSPDAQMVFTCIADEIDIKCSGTFAITKSLQGKLVNIFIKMRNFWFEFFNSDIHKRGILTASQMPAMDDEDDCDIVGETFEEIRDDMEPLESLDDEDGDDDGEEAEGYEYDDPAGADDEA